MKLTKEQNKIVDSDANQLVIACPGSGKTRILTAKLIKFLGDSDKKKGFVVGLTFTNRAADEIWSRVDSLGVDHEQLWIGTFHKFCIDWIIRPFAGFHELTKNGFTLIEQNEHERLIRELKQENNLGFFAKINTKPNRNGQIHNAEKSYAAIVDKYKVILRERKLIDFDEVLLIAFELLRDNPNIRSTIANVIFSFCIDEFQDTQDTQYGVIELLARTNQSIKLFLVGDPNQAIYEGLGAQVRTKKDLEYTMTVKFEEHSLEGCFRSAQRIVEFYSNFQVIGEEISAQGENANYPAIICFDDSTHLDDLNEVIAKKIESALLQGIPEHEICVVAPQWQHITPISNGLRQRLPKTNFDAPGASPFRKCQENTWFKIARLKLTDPSPTLFNIRIRWAKDAIESLCILFGSTELKKTFSPYSFLEAINSIKVNDTDGLVFLEKLYSEFLDILSQKLLLPGDVVPSKDEFLIFIAGQLHNDEHLPRDVVGFKNCFKERTGIVINTCYGLKGEEFEVVIAFGLLKGFIPHWDIIRAGIPDAAEESADRLLYVTCSRAKSQLHLISERGRFTQGRMPYNTTENLKRIKFKYD